MGELTPALLDALRRRADDPRSFIDMPELSEFRRFPPATHAQIDRASRQLGIPVPAVLRTIYVEVANGGFGPGYGLLGVDSGATDDSGANLERAYVLLSAPDPEVPDWGWLEGALPVAIGAARSIRASCRTGWSYSSTATNGDARRCRSRTGWLDGSTVVSISRDAWTPPRRRRWPPRHASLAGIP
jgi:hypothetical protein